MENKILEELRDLKAKEDAVILAHYYVDKEIQKNADYVGDSFYLAQKAKELKNKTIVMAGVYFMGESVKILNPDKTVLMVDMKADCPMAYMIDVEKIEKMRKEYEDLAVVCYINSTAEIKAHSDVCVTSSNALKIVNKLEEKNIFFIPDGNLALHIAEYVKDKNIIANDGYCPVHNSVKERELRELKDKLKDVKVLAHPECPPNILKFADYIGSTKGIIEEAGKEGEEFIIVTEIGIATRLKELYPNKTFYFLDDFVCADMKLLSMEKLVKNLRDKENKVEVDENIAKKALLPLERMLDLGADK